MRLVLLCSLALLGRCELARAQEVVIEPVLGQIQIDNEGQYSCQLSGNQVCGSCVQDEDDPGSIPPLIISFGQSGLSGWSFGTMSGEIRPAVEIDGVRVLPSLLPSGSYFTSGIGVGLSFTPIQPCPAQGLTYQIGPVSGNFTESGNQEIVIPADEADAVPFLIDFCNVAAHWGAGCNVSGSINDRWLLHAPADVYASVIDPGDPAPISFSGPGLVVDFEQSGGGILTAIRSEDTAPAGPVPDGPSGYWELQTDMPDASYLATVTVSFDPASLPAGTDPAQLMLARYDDQQGGWESLASVVDTVAGTVTAQTGGLSLFVLTTENVVEVRVSSWSRVKATF
jgi:hypothetical protein